MAKPTAGTISQHSATHGRSAQANTITMSDIAFSETDVKNFGTLLSYFKQLAQDGVTPLIEKQLLLMLDQSIPFFGHLHSQEVFPELVRITINKRILGENRRIKNLAQLKYPPPEKVTKYGRCNLPGQSVFYGAYTRLTAFSELKPRAGDMVTISHWKLRDQNARLKFCPIFKNQPKERNVINPRMLEYNNIYEKKVEGYPTHFKRQMDDLIQFVADAFTKFVNPGNDLDYIFSSYFSNKILYEFENGSIDAIYYTSVQEKLHFENIAIKPEVFEKLYIISEVHDEVLTRDPSDGGRGYFGHGFGHCKNFNFVSGEILWDPSQLKTNEDSILELKWKYGYKFSLD